MTINAIGPPMFVARPHLSLDSTVVTATTSPASAGGDQFTAAPASPSPDGRTTGSQPTRRIAIVADDDEGLLRIVPRVLTRSLGFTSEHVLTADNREAAMVVFSAHTADVVVVISDMEMPYKNDGIEFYRTVRERSPHMPFLFISGVMTAETKAELETILTTDVHTRFLDKPFVPAQLTAALQALGV